MIRNRQTIRSKKMIEGSIIKLLEKKKISQITVKELCEMSDINRGTFYNHYVDIYDLMNQIENNLITELESSLSKYSSSDINKDSLPLFKEVLGFISQNKDVVAILLKNEDSLFMDKVIDLFKARAIHIWGKSYDNSKNIKYLYFVEYVIYGCIGIIKKWFKDGLKDDSDTLAILIDNIVTNGSTLFKNNSLW